MNFAFLRRPRRRPNSLITFDDECRDITAAARNEAQRLGNEYVGTEHFTLGFLTPDSPGLPLLTEMGIDTDSVRTSLERACGPFRQSLENLPYTSRVKKIFELAMLQAQESDRLVVTVPFLLQGILLEGKGIGAQKLIEAGVTVEVLETYVTKGTRAEQTFRIELSDGSDLSITEQIVAKVAEAIATGQLREGQRLPTVRRMADELDIAPGTVARAYTELELRGAVRTDGARGTTVARRDAKTLELTERVAALTVLMRPIAVEGFHIGASMDEMRQALERAVDGVNLGNDAIEGQSPAS